MPTEVIVSLVGAVGLVMSGVLVELVRSRRGRVADHQVMTAKVDQLAGDVGGLDTKVDAVKDDVHAIHKEHGERLARIEGQFEGHMLERTRR